MSFITLTKYQQGLVQNDESPQIAIRAEAIISFERHHEHQYTIVYYCSNSSNFTAYVYEAVWTIDRMLR